MNSRSFAGAAGAAIIAVGVVVCAARSIPHQPPQAASTSAPTPPPATLVGVGGCAAAGCHNANGRPGTAGSEYSTWASLDPHSRAYDVLRAPRSVEMVKRLGWTTKAHESTQCLACHGTTSPDVVAGPDALGDGVGCESCHGPASRWRSTHYLALWKSADAASKQYEGFRDLKDLSRRAARCAECHVGSPGADVTHDLIAAGHPRLTFEFAAYHHLMPRHWRGDAGPEFEARAWLTGQVEAARAAVSLLADRAGRPGAWPELAEFNCYACHHTLQPESWRQRRGSAPGALAWSDWNVDLPRTLIRLRAPGVPADDPLTELATMMANPAAPREKVAAAARAAAQKLADWSRTIADRPLTPAQADTVARALLADMPTQGLDWDQAAQRYLALTAMSIASGRSGNAAVREPLDGLRRRLAFPAGSDSPTQFTPAQYREALEALRRAWTTE